MGTGHRLAELCCTHDACNHLWASGFPQLRCLYSLLSVRSSKPCLTSDAIAPASDNISAGHPHLVSLVDSCSWTYHQLRFCMSTEKKGVIVIVLCKCPSVPTVVAPNLTPMFLHFRCVPKEGEEASVRSGGVVFLLADCSGNRAVPDVALFSLPPSSCPLCISL